MTPTKPKGRRTARLARHQKRRAAGTQPGDIVLSSHFACTDCGISFDEPTPQLFSFNSPQGMCLTCDGLGEFFSFDAGPTRPRHHEVVRARLHRADRPVEGLGPLEAPHLSRRRRNDGAQARPRRRHAARNALEGAHRGAARHLALGHRRRAHHLHLAGRQSGSEIRRHVRRPHSRAAGEIQHQQKHDRRFASSKST